MEETISLKDIFVTLRRRIKTLIIIPIITVLISGLVSFFVLTPMYQNSTQLLVNQEQQDQFYSQADIRTNIELINTYNVIIKSPAILEKVIDEANLIETYDQLNSKVTVGSEGNSQVVRITVQHEQPHMAAEIANTIANIFQREIVSIMNVDNVSILSQAKLTDNPTPVKPNPYLNMAIAFVVGLMAAVGLIFLLEFLDTSIKDENDVEAVLGLPVLGVVPDMGDERGKRRKKKEKELKRKER
ncbi:YveK family protein [Bacillus alkalicellulosilyticus]|uniref:YveK family protein n=1 Tax=Alkalihalobacterium alkalicellulosilyticum TaxID=1912214 RepID=UPI00099741F9|nr:Wzz/FepE/Etk N-terminal domain-containing protein [Bacillus alkalicellulosilyticus]